MPIREVLFLPRFNLQEPGGVAVHIRTLARNLTARGWSVVDQPGPQTLVHAHAQARAPEVHVYTNHGIYPLADHMPGWQQNANTAIFENLKLADEVIAVSNWTASQWASLIGRRPHIIPNAVDPAQWQNVPRGRWRGRLAIHDATPIVVWGKASLSPVLDPTPLVELALRYPKWRFVAPLRPEMLSTAPPNLTCIGLQPFEAMQMLLADCDVYLATVQENHSIQVLEAMLLGKPILGYAWGGTAETVTAGGCLVPPHDLTALAQALPAVYDDRQDLGAAGRAHVLAHYTTDQQTAAVEEVYAMAQATQKGRAPGQRNSAIKCSIIIPVYNKAPWVAETIKSALTQVRAPKYEVIVVDDGSTDNSLEEAQRAVASAVGVQVPPRCRVYSLPNGGVAAARNYGISNAHGEYICCLDADDKIDPYFLQRLSAVLEADPGLGIAYSDFTAFGTNEKGMPFEAQITCADFDFEKLKQGNLLPCCNLFRKVAWERAGGYRDINPSWEDYDLWLRMAKMGWPARRAAGYFGFWYRKTPKVGRDFQSHGQEWRLRAIVNKGNRDLYPPAVSVVIPCYGYSRFLAEAIDSVKAQTFVDWEVVVVDDGNPEEEAQAIADIVASYNDQDIRLVRQNENGGLANARNIGIEMAQGSWIVPLDADDKLAPTFVEVALRATGLDAQKFGYTDAYLWWPDADPETRLLEAQEYDFDTLLTRITWGCTILYAKDAWRKVGGYKPQMSEAGGWEDWEFVVNLGVNGICGVHAKEPGFYYRQHSANQMRLAAEEKKPRLQEAMRRIWARVYEGERPPMCCGQGRKTRGQAPAPEAAQRSMPPVAQRAAAQAAAGTPEVVIRYVGPRAGSQTWRGPSGRGYQFSRFEPLQRVAAEDVAFFLQHQDFQKVTA